MTTPENTRPIFWTARAARELDAIGRYLEAINPLAAQRLTLKLRSAAESLASYPDRYRADGRDRELVTVRPYVLRYRVEAERVLILRVRHGARRPLKRRDT